MFQNRRTVFLFICLTVFVQAIYYIITFQLKRNRTAIIPFSDIFPYEESSDIAKASLQNATTSISLQTKLLLVSNNLNNTSIQKELTTELIPFVGASFLTAINFTGPDPTIYNSLPICQFSITNNDSSIYKVEIHKDIYPFYIIEKHHGDDLYPGGHWFPKTCRTEQRLALIICYRNRETHLKLFLDNIHSFLKKQQLDYTIFIVNQHGREQFNRAALFNVGYIEAMKLYSFNCFIFHDVDLLPEDLRNLYKCGEKPRHM
jgi:hypothetical protein